MDHTILDTTSVYAHPGMGTLGTNVMIKVVPQKYYIRKENLKLHYYYMNQPQETSLNWTLFH